MIRIRHRSSLTRAASSTAVLALGLVLAGATGCESGTSASGTSPRGSLESGPPKLVRVAPVTQSKLAKTISVTGTLAADEQAILSFKVTGRLAEIPIDLGSRVRKGDVIAKLDTTDFELRVRHAETAVGQARARLGLPIEGDDDHVDPNQTSLVRQARATREEAILWQERMSALSKQELVAKSQFDSAEASREVAEGRLQDALEEVRNRQAMLAQRRAELSIVSQHLADCVLRAPMDGAIRLRQASAGEYVSAGDPVATLVDLDPLRLRVAVPEREAPAIRAGQSVRLSIEGDPEKYTGHVVRLSPAISEQNRTLLIEAEVPNEEGRLRPGSFVEGEVVVESEEPVLLVPESAIVSFAGLEKVLVVREGRAVEKRVRTGRRSEAGVEIVEGLTTEDPVILEPGSLVGGQPVAIATS